MTFTIKEVSEKTNLTIPTIRYYEKEGLLPPVNRNNVGVRIFSDGDLEWLSLICCLRNTGMPVRNIKKFVQWCLEGYDTLDKRIDMLVAHKKSVEEQQEILTHFKCSIDWKINYYKDLQDKYEKGELK